MRALEGDEFKQTQQSLRDDGAYCCLGVACEMHRRQNPDEFHWEHWGSYDGCDDFLPPSVQEWLGLVSENPSVDKVSVVNMNDDLLNSFREIAAKLRAAREAGQL